MHPAAHVNHVLPYHQLFAANVVGSAEVIRLGITLRLKPIHYISTMGVSAAANQLVDEDTDIRRAVPACTLTDGYANGYAISKWAGEVLMRQGHDLCGLPVAVFRPGIILADSRYAGQLNVPDIFTRLLFSLVATGVAPRSFYRAPEHGGRPHYEGLPVDFLADAIAAIGPQHGTASTPTTPPTRTTTASPWTPSSTGSSRRAIPLTGSTITQPGWLASRRQCGHCPNGSVRSRC